MAEKLINFLQQIPLKIEADLNRDLVIADDRDLIIQKTVLAAQAIFDAPQLWEDLIEGIKKVNNKVSDIETVINTLFLTTIPTLIKDKEEQLYLAMAIQSKKVVLLTEISKMDSDVVADIKKFLLEDDQDDDDEKVIHRPTTDQFVNDYEENLQEAEVIKSNPPVNSAVEDELQGILAEVEELLRLRVMEWQNKKVVIGIFEFLFKHERIRDVIHDYRALIELKLDDSIAQKTIFGKKMDHLFADVIPAIMKTFQFRHFTIYNVYSVFEEEYAKISQRYLIRKEDEKKIKES